MLEGPSFTELTLLSVFLKKNVVYFDVIFFFIICKSMVRYFLSDKSSSGLMLCGFCICHSVEDSRYSVNNNCTDEQAGNVLVTYNFSHFLSAGGCFSKWKFLLMFMHSIILSMVVLASFSPSPLPWVQPIDAKWHSEDMQQQLITSFEFFTCICPMLFLPALIFIFITILPEHTKFWTNALP